MVNPVSTFLFFLLGSAQRLLCFRLGKVTFFARLVDWVAVEEVALRHEYSFVERLLQEQGSPMVVDLGANIGMFSTLIFHLCPMATVHSVEPSPTTFQILDKNRKTNLALNWYTYQSAIWAEDGNVNFEENCVASTASFVSVENGNATVPAMTLEKLYLKYIGTPISLLKIDIEGAEGVVLSQSSRVLQDVEAVIVEVHPYRCDPSNVIRVLCGSFNFVYEVGQRISQKPLLLATRIPYDFPAYNNGLGPNLSGELVSRC
jgi:FkbM family methyltransferase